MPTLDQWRDRLLTELSGRQHDIAWRRRYFDGDHPLPAAPDSTTADYRRLARLGVTNLMALIVNAVCDGLIPRDIRVSADEAENLRVWREVWQANALDADSRMVHEEALKVGRSFVLVWPDPADVDGVSVTPEDPADVIVAYRAGSRRERVAALKRWRVDPFDLSSDECVTVWTPDQVQTWVREVKPDSRWGPMLDYGSGVNPLGVVPIVEFPCQPTINGQVSPEISDAAIVLQDRINKTGFDCVVAGEYGAFPQRATLGVEIPMETVTVNGQQVTRPKNPLEAGPNRVWALKQVGDQQGKIIQLEPFPTDGMLKQIETWTMQLASLTQTPVFHLFSGAANIGAEFIERIEAAHQAKVRGHQVIFGERWEEVVALSMRARGETPPADVEIGWMPIQPTPAERADMAAKYSAAGMDRGYIARELGETPSEIERSSGVMPAADDTPVGVTP